MLNAVSTKAFTIVALNIVSFVAVTPAHANECAGIADNEHRLACYDKLFLNKPDAQPSPTPKNTEEPVRLTKLDAESAPPPAHARSKMIEDWDLEAESSRNSFELRTYKPVYILLATHSTNANRQPRSDNPENQVGAPITGLSANESQFQLSFKTKMLSNIFGDNGNLWVGYTQSSRWQIYSGTISRPFRETNYEPEATLMFRTPFSLGNWNLRMSGVSINHQSNGRANPLSRSWNRIIGVFGIENGDLSVQIRPWVRLKEGEEDDNNPDIENYIGRGEVIVSQHIGGHVISFTGRHSLRSGENSHGSAKLEWTIPISGNLKGLLSVFSGYGESLIDYNHRQTMFGAGVSLVNW